MKKIYKLSIGLLMTVFMVACHDLTELNVNPNGVDPNNANPNLVLSSVLSETGLNYVSLNFDDVMGGLMQHTQKDGWVGSHNSYDWGGSQSWSSWYNILRDNQYVHDRSVELGFELQQGITLVMKSMLFGLIADLWGDAPYSNALKGAEGGSAGTFPVFDSQEDIYNGIIADLERANEILSKGQNEYTSPTGSADLYYNGNAAKWRKFGNSLMLRYYNRISIKNPGVAKAGIEKIAGNPSQYPLITSAGDDATMGFAGNSNADSWPANAVYDASESSYRRIKMANTLVERLLELNDPRISVWAQKVEIPLVVVDSLSGRVDQIVDGVRILSPERVEGHEINTHPEYVGLPTAIQGPAGYNLSPTAEQAARNPHVSWLNDMYRQAKGPLLLARFISAAEVNFILAEAAQRGWTVGGSAEDYYNAAIGASFDAWGLSAMAGPYISSPNVQYDGSLKQLMEQKWIASWTAAGEAWFDYRRTGYPELTTGPHAKRSVLPVRFYYMLDELNLNKANADAALSRLQTTTYTEADGPNSAWSKPWVLQGTDKPW